MSGLRVISGKARGHRLRSVPGSTTRPITDRTKEALYNILGGDIHSATFLDLYAGTGSVGIEALSRGARRVVFVESDVAVLKILRQNLQILPATDVLVLAGELPGDLERISGRLPTAADLIFADPPYGFAAYDELLSAVGLDSKLPRHRRQRGAVIECEIERHVAQ